MTTTKNRHSAPGTKGRVLHSAAGYDLLAWLLLLGRERAFRERLVGLARLEPGQSVLDIGCGTGSLAQISPDWSQPWARAVAILPAPRKPMRSVSLIAG